VFADEKAETDFATHCRFGILDLLKSRLQLFIRHASHVQGGSGVDRAAAFSCLFFSRRFIFFSRLMRARFSRRATSFSSSSFLDCSLCSFAAADFVRRAIRAFLPGLLRLILDKEGSGFEYAGACSSGGLLSVFTVITRHGKAKPCQNDLER
jgi:hypothetical protein